MKIREIILSELKINKDVHSLGRQYSANPRTQVDQHSDLSDTERADLLNVDGVDTPYIGKFMQWPKNKTRKPSNSNSTATNKPATKAHSDEDFYLTTKQLFTQNKELGELFVDTFGKQAKEKGYEPERRIYKQDATLSITTKNDLIVSLGLMKTASKPSVFIGRFSTPEVTVEMTGRLQDQLEGLNVRYLDDNPKTKTIRIDFDAVMSAATKKSNPNLNTLIIKPLQAYWNIVSAVESLGALEDAVDTSDRAPGSGRGSGADIIRPRTPLRYYIGAAEMIQVAVKRSLGNVIARGTGALYDMADNMITVGMTAEAHRILKDGNPKTKPYREHTVPCELIVKTAVNMFQKQNASVMDVAKMIRRNLMIVLTSPAEAARLDEKYKTTMPSGWNAEDGHPLARFRAVNPPIPVYSIEDGDNKRLSEDD